MSDTVEHLFSTSDPSFQLGNTTTVTSFFRTVAICDKLAR